MTPTTLAAGTLVLLGLMFGLLLLEHWHERRQAQRRREERERNGPEFCFYCFTNSPKQCTHSGAEAMRARYRNAPRRSIYTRKAGEE